MTWRVGDWCQLAEIPTWAVGGFPLVGQVVYLAPNDEAVVESPIYGELQAERDALRTPNPLLVLALVAAEEADDDD